MTNKIKGYCKPSADKCRRSELFHFPSSATECIDAAVPKHMCCDHCTVICDCDDELKILYLLSGQQHTQDYGLLDKVETRYVSSEQRVQLRELLAFRQEVLKAADIYIPIDNQLESVLASSVVESIVDNCEYIFTVEELEEMCGMLFNGHNENY